MASDPGCLRFSLLFRIRLFLPSGFSCLHGFPAVPLFLPSRFSVSSPLSCLHAAFPASTAVLVRLRYPACPTDCCLSDRCWSDSLSGRPVVCLACPTDCWLFDRCWSDPLSGRPGIRPAWYSSGLVFVRPVVRLACCPSGPRPFQRPFQRPLCRPATVQGSPDFPRARPATCLTAVLAESGRRPPVSSSSLRRRP